MPEEKSQFMVDFTMPKVITERFTKLIPYQRATVNRFFSENKLTNYSVSLESARLWAIFNADSESEVIQLVEQLPLTIYMPYQIYLLTFYNNASAQLPSFSMN